MPTSPVDSGSAAFVRWGAVLAVCVAGLVGVARWPVATEVVPPAELPPTPVEPAVAPAVDRAALFDGEVAPAIAAVDAANRAAANRCVARLRDTVAQYRNGVPAFAEELTGFGTRFGVLKRMPGDWWYEQDDVGHLVREKFERNLFSQQRLESDIALALGGFRDEVAANQNRLLTEVRVALSQADLPEVPELEGVDFRGEAVRALERYSTAAATTSAGRFVATEVLAGVGGEVAAQLAAGVAARVGASLATSTAVAGGATAAGGAGGGAGGSTLGPVGTAVGFGVGLAVGIGIDWWMTSSFEAELTTQMNALCDQLEREIIGSPERPGVEASLHAACDALATAYRETLFQRIVLLVDQPHSAETSP